MPVDHKFKSPNCILILKFLNIVLITINSQCGNTFYLRKIRLKVCLSETHRQSVPIGITPYYYSLHACCVKGARSELKCQVA